MSLQNAGVHSQVFNGQQEAIWNVRPGSKITTLSPEHITQMKPIIQMNIKAKISHKYL